MLEIGTASVRNYVLLATKWFELDLTAYNFFLMPISFYHGFEAAEPVTRANYPKQIQKLLAYLDSLDKQEERGADQQFALRLETKFVRTKDVAGVPIRWTNNITAPAITMREEDVLRNHPLTYNDLTKLLRGRYEDFQESKKYHGLRQNLEVSGQVLHRSVLKSPKPKKFKATFLRSKHSSRIRQALCSTKETVASVHGARLR